MDSHFVPKFMYKLLRQTGASNPNPLLFSHSGIVQTSWQETAYVLCKNCEDLFAKKGELYVSKVCRRSETDFKLKDILQSSKPIHFGGPTQTMKAYRPSAIPEINVTSLTYFGSSILWRASVWSSLRPEHHFASMKSNYQEAFRLFLSGQTSFPSDVAVSLTVVDDKQGAQDPDMTRTMVFPYKYEHESITYYRFALCGFVFQFDFDPKLNLIKGKSEYFFPGDIIVLAPWSDCGIFTDSMGLLKKAYNKDRKGS